MILNSFRDQYKKYKFETLDKTVGLIEFINSNSTNMLMEIFSTLTKIDKQKYNIDEVWMIYKLYKLPNDTKKVSLELKSILRYIQKLKIYIDELEASKNQNNSKKMAYNISDFSSVSTSKGYNSANLKASAVTKNKKNFKRITFPQRENEQWVQGKQSKESKVNQTSIKVTSIDLKLNNMLTQNKPMNSPTENVLKSYRKQKNDKVNAFKTKVFKYSISNLKSNDRKVPKPMYSPINSKMIKNAESTKSKSKYCGMYDVYRT